MHLPGHLRYAATHEWAAAGADGIATVGLTAVATDQLGELIFVALPEVGRRVAAGESCATVESTKAAADVHAPCTGDVVAVNDALARAPETVNASPYEAGWLFRLRPVRLADLESLLDARAYRAALRP